MKIQFLALVVLATAATATFAGDNAAPLGFEVGETTCADLQAKLRGRAQWVDKGVNRYSGGHMLESDGRGFDVEGLKAATLVCDRQGRLAAVVLQLPKEFGNKNTARVADMLRQKYRQVERNIPAVGNASARFTQGTSAIQLDAPHMSFDFTVAYMTLEFERALNEAHLHGKANRDRATQRGL